MSFLTFLLCTLVFAAVSVVVGWAWFAFCRWNELLVARNYRVLVVVIPMTFLLAFAVNCFTQYESKPPEPFPIPRIEKKEKKETKKLKPKPAIKNTDEEAGEYLNE